MPAPLPLGPTPPSLLAPLLLGTAPLSLLAPLPFGPAPLSLLAPLLLALEVPPSAVVLPHCLEVLPQAALPLPLECPGGTLALLLAAIPDNGLRKEKKRLCKNKHGGMPKVPQKR